MKRTLYGFLVFIVLIACRALTPSTISTQNVELDSTSYVDTPTALVLAQTPILSAETTPIPEVTQSSSPTYFSWVNIASQESEGMKIEIAYLYLVVQASVPDYSLIQGLEDKQTICIIYFRITNTASRPLSLYFGGGTEAIIRDERIYLGENFSYYATGAPLFGELAPGDSKAGGIMFGIKNSSLPQIKNMTISLSGPQDSSGTAVGKDYIFNLDLSDRQQQPKPEDLP